MNSFDYFKKLVSLPSPSKEESLVSSFLKDEMKSFGYETKEDDYGNLLFYRNPETPKILFCAHMDTVAAAVNAHLVETDDRFTTDGTTALGADDKAALAVMLNIAKDANDRFAILATSAEEIGLYGSSKLSKDFFSILNIEACYVFDAQTNVGKIISSAVGKSRLTFTFMGKSAHAGFAPEDGINAIMMASNFCSDLRMGRIKESTTVNVGSFIAEGSTNVVPEKATVTIEVRSDENETRFDIIEEMKRKALRVASTYKGNVDIKDEDLYQPYRIDQDSSLFNNAFKAVESAGLKPMIESTTGGSDANNLNKIGIPTLLFSSGYFNGHAKSEYVEKKEFLMMEEIIKILINQD